MEGLEQFLTTELGAMMVCAILLIREINKPIIEWIRSKKSGEKKRATDTQIAQILAEIEEINKKLREGG